MGNIFNQNTFMENQSKIIRIVAENVTRLMSQSLTLNTIAAVAAKSGMGTGTVDRIKKGQVSTTIDKIEQLAEAFGVPVCTLVAKGGIPADADLYYPETKEIIRIMQDTDNRGREKILSRAKDELLLHNAFLRQTSIETAGQISGISKVNRSISDNSSLNDEIVRPPEAQ